MPLPYGVNERIQMNSSPSGSFSRQPRAPAQPAVTVNSFLSSLRALVGSFVHLLVLEAKQAGLSFVFMLTFGIAAAVLIITGWLALVACVVFALVSNEILGGVAALFLAALLSFAGSAVLGYLVIRRAKDLLFTATRRQIAGDASTSEVEYGNPPG